MTCIQDIDYFIYCNKFYFSNKAYPVEIGISEIGKYHSTQVITVDLVDFYEFKTDITKNVDLIKTSHGIENLYLNRLNYNDDDYQNGYYGIRYKNLPMIMKFLFPKKRTVFGVKGREQKEILKRVLQQDDDDDDENKFIILEIEEVFGCRLDIYTYLKIAPTLHTGFHKYPFDEDACAAKIAFNYAEYLRDRIKFGDVESLNFNGKMYWDYEIAANNHHQQQQQQQQNQTKEEEEEEEDDDDCQIIDIVPPPPQPQQQQQQQNLQYGVENDFIPLPRGCFGHQQISDGVENRRYFDV